MACLRTVFLTAGVALMALATHAACALAAVQSIPPQPGIARDGPRSHASPWPIYNRFDHQPTENELRGHRQVNELGVGKRLNAGHVDIP